MPSTPIRGEMNTYSSTNTESKDVTIARLSVELARVTAQRDRLRDALEDLDAAYEEHSGRHQRTRLIIECDDYFDLHPGDMTD